MAVTLKTLYQQDDNPFQLTLHTGKSNERNAVSWVHLLEDEAIITYFHGAELAVTTCMKCAAESSWLLTLVKKLIEGHASGLIINVGKFIVDIPQDVIDYCTEKEFPLLTMPWEIKITDLIQNFCMKIINEQYESGIHDRAMRDAILKRENEKEYREILEKYYDLKGKFNVIQIYVDQDEQSRKANSREYILWNQLRRFRSFHNLKKAKFGLISYEDYELVVLSNVDASYLMEILRSIFDVYQEAAEHKCVFVGVGIEVIGLENINKSYERAQTALRMAIYRNEPFIKFEEMGIYKILFSIRDKEVLYSYANELLAPLDACAARREEYLELLKVYIENDRSLEHTAKVLYIHRNTVNYQVQKIKSLLNSPLKTAEDLLPYQLALAIRDMEMHEKKLHESSFL
ncbi:MAG: PucR family transcriptional regulator [Lachnospiraceae bacterium]